VYSKARVLTRLIALVATVTLALAVSFRSPSDYRMVVCIVVSLAATTLVVRCLFTGKLMWAFAFLGILGVFTPFQLNRFSHELISIVDMASLALFAASPLFLRRSTMIVVPQGRS
jgi:hypothetical protein